MDQLLTAFGEGRKNGTFEAGIATGIRRMLMDPAFLFRIERDPPQLAANTPYRISDLELASRLSFFLWSSIPDEAVTSCRRRWAVYEMQGCCSGRFGACWPTLARATWSPTSDTSGCSCPEAEGVHPDPVIFTDFDDSLRRAFIQETELLLQSVLLGDHSVLDLLNAKYTFVNERLASHYGIPGVYGDQFRRVEVNDGIRGGLLGQGSILTATSYPNRTSPVLRGKWILEVLLGSPPPPPPPEVPALPEVGEGGKVLSVRERLSEHRKNAVCASCHVRMDPLGFALENFDATGTMENRRDEWSSRSDAATDRPIRGVARWNEVHRSRRPPANSIRAFRPVCLHHDGEAAHLRVGKRRGLVRCAGHPRRRARRPERMTIAFRRWSPVLCSAGRSKCECRKAPMMRGSARLSRGPSKPKGAPENAVGFSEKEIRIFSMERKVHRCS